MRPPPRHSHAACQRCIVHGNGLKRIPALAEHQVKDVVLLQRGLPDRLRDQLLVWKHGLLRPVRGNARFTSPSSTPYLPFSTHLVGSYEANVVRGLAEELGSLESYAASQFPRANTHSRRSAALTCAMSFPNESLGSTSMKIVSACRLMRRCMTALDAMDGVAGAEVVFAVCALVPRKMAAGLLK